MQVGAVRNINKTLTSQQSVNIFVRVCSGFNDSTNFIMLIILLYHRPVPCAVVCGMCVRVRVHVWVHACVRA